MVMKTFDPDGLTQPAGLGSVVVCTSITTGVRRVDRLCPAPVLQGLTGAQSRYSVISRSLSGHVNLSGFRAWNRFVAQANNNRMGPSLILCIRDLGSQVQSRALWLGKPTHQPLCCGPERLFVFLTQCYETLTHCRHGIWIDRCVIPQATQVHPASISTNHKQLNNPCLPTHQRLEPIPFRNGNMGYPTAAQVHHPT